MQIVDAATSAALSQFNLGTNPIDGGKKDIQAASGAIVGPQSAMINACASVKRYSLILNPSIYLLGEEAASIAYTKLNHILDLASDHMRVEQSEETRIWHKKDGAHWVCVHLHTSRLSGKSNCNSSDSKSPGPELSQSLVRSMANQQLAAAIQFNNQLIQQHHSQQQPQQRQLNNLANSSVPIISLNHSSAGSGVSASQAQQPQQQQQQQQQNR